MLSSVLGQFSTSTGPIELLEDEILDDFDNLVDRADKLICCVSFPTNMIVSTVPRDTFQVVLTGESWCRFSPLIGEDMSEK